MRGCKPTPPSDAWGSRQRTAAIQAAQREKASQEASRASHVRHDSLRFQFSQLNRYHGRGLL
ncbi:hypothetical protein [Streptomyces griseus]|uniref:hypothetical protein n=1 Tax=Streptomyces griseus TaxID=1911 RepID=UPI000561B8EF|nr:hypothetical protein [Streptomyces griseus]